MIKTILGLILLLVPFLLVCRFKNKKLGFSYILIFLMAFHLFVSILTQTFRIFNYSVILIINIILAVAVLIKTDFKQLKEKTKHIKIDWVLFAVVIILFIELFSVHYDYSGKYTIVTTPEYQEAENMKYIYPYFSDEWYAIAFIKQAIKRHSLPFCHPFRWNEKFINLEFPFHSFLSELVLLLNLDPSRQYITLTIFSGMLICILIYFFLRINKISKMPAAIASLSASYITNGANLPGLWTLIPMTVGIIPILLSFIFISQNNLKMTLFSSILAILFYPPFFIIYLVSLISFILWSKDTTSKKIKNILYYLLTVIILGSILSVTYFLYDKSIIGLIKYVWFTKFFYNTFTGNFNPVFVIYKIIPVPILALALFGLLLIFKRKIWLTSLLLLGILYWTIYSFTTLRFIFEYERVVVLTSILIVIFAGFGLSLLIKILNEYIKKSILDYIQLGVVLLFFVFSFTYTQRENWQSLKLINVETKQTFLPAAPANRYLHPDDLTLFANLSNKTFLSLPWKGTVIGVTTDNYPLNTKPGTVTMNRDLFTEFMNMNCDEKYNITKIMYIEYIYTPKIDCPNMELIGTSSEGLHLYKVIKAS